MKINVRYKILATLLVLGLLLIITGCGNKDEADREQLDEIATKVATLFNEDKTDLARDFDSNVFDNIEQLLEAETNKELNEENEQYLQRITADYELALKMIAFENSVLDLVEQEGDIDAKLLATLQEETEVFALQSVFYERLIADLVIIEERLERQVAERKAIDKAKKAVAKLFNGDDVKNDVTKEAYETASKIVEKINDEKLQKEFTAQLKKVDAKLKEIADAEKKKAEQEKAKAEAAQQATRKTEIAKGNTSSSSNSATDHSKQGSSTNNKNNSSSGSKSKDKTESKKCKEVMLPGNSLGNTGTEFSTIEEAIEWGNYNGFEGEAWYEKGYTSWWAQPVFYGCEGQLDIPSGDVVVRTTYTVDFRK